MTRVLIHSQTPQKHIARLTGDFPEVTFLGCSRNSAMPEILDSFRPDAMFSVNISSDAPYPRTAVMDSSLSWVSVGGSGTDHIAPWDTENLTVTNSAGVAADMMAEYCIGAFVHFNIDVPGLMRDQASRVWNRDRGVKPLAGQVLLIVGLGHTGRVLAARAKAFGMIVIGTRANPQSTPNCDEVYGADSLPQLWPRADFVAICTPRLPSTVGLVNAQAFSLMKDDAVLVNVARGGVVDEAALMVALKQGKLRGAAMDVFDTEPLASNSPVWNTPNLDLFYMTWHKRNPTQCTIQ